MRSVEDALSAMLAAARPTSVETVPLDAVAGRVPAEFVVRAAVDVPPWANSSMDGFAVRAAETPGALALVGEVAAGGWRDAPLEPGTAVRIMTGAPLPRGADGVAPVEVAIEGDGIVQVPEVAPGAYVRAQGEDTRAGEPVELRQAPLSPAAVAVVASLGIGALPVRRPPVVAILSTGDELRAPGEHLAPGQIHDANSFSLAAAVREAGGEPRVVARVGDDPAAIGRAVEAAVAEADLLVASGGVSVGRHDHVRTVIERLGSLDFWRIAVQPGKPLAFGEVSGRPVVGLPGNPVSALVTFELFVRPLIRAMLGLPGTGRVTVRAVAADRMAKDRARRAYLRVRIGHERDRLVARAAGGQGSAQLRPLAAANGLMIVPEGQDAAVPGAAYDALLTDELDG